MFNSGCHLSVLQHPSNMSRCASNLIVQIKTLDALSYKSTHVLTNQICSVPKGVRNMKRFAYGLSLCLILAASPVFGQLFQNMLLLPAPPTMLKGDGSVTMSAACMNRDRKEPAEGHKFVKYVGEGTVQQVKNGVTTEL